MFDVLTIFRILLSIWPFLKEHFFESEKILRHFQNRKSELTLFLFHILLIVMVINVHKGVKDTLIRFKDTEREMIAYRDDNVVLKDIVMMFESDGELDPIEVEKLKLTLHK